MSWGDQLTVGRNFRTQSALLALLAVLGTGCPSEPGLRPLEKMYLSESPPGQVEMDFCTDPAQQVQSKLKYIVILDHSGSNITNYKIDPATGDPDLSSGS